MTTVTYQIPRISCGGCVNTIQTAVGKLDGVKSIKVSVATKKVEIVFDAPASEEQIKKRLKEINYPAAA